MPDAHSGLKIPYSDPDITWNIHKSIYEWLLKESAYMQKELAMDQAFYIVWSPSGVTNPRVTFRTEAGAKAEAERMGLYHQKKFHWCKVMGATEPPPKMITTVFA